MHAAPVLTLALPPFLPLPCKQEWCDVTVATQFLVDNRCLVFHQGVSKAGLMGFYDMAPGESKELWVMYLLGGVPCRSQGEQPPDGPRALARPAFPWLRVYPPITPPQREEERKKRNTTRTDAVIRTLRIRTCTACQRSEV